jgi:hypothetical protein
MATVKAKRKSAGVKGSSRLKKGSALKPVKPLESLHIPYPEHKLTYT